MSHNAAIATFPLLRYFSKKKVVLTSFSIFSDIKLELINTSANLTLDLIGIAKQDSLDYQVCTELQWCLNALFLGYKYAPKETLQKEVDTLAHNIIQRSARDLVNFYKAKKTPCHFIKHRITVLSSFIDDPKSLLQ